METADKSPRSHTYAHKYRETDIKPQQASILLLQESFIVYTIVPFTYVYLSGHLEET